MTRPRSCRITPKGKLRAWPAPTFLNCDTSSYQLFASDKPARQLHPTFRQPFADGFRSFLLFGGFYSRIPERTMATCTV
jgi:hypothetical protein